MSMDISIRDIHNDMIKPYDNAWLVNVFDSVTQKLLISDTTLRQFIPQQVRKMNPKLYQIWGCELCIIPKYMKIDLNRFRTNIVKYLQHKSVGTHTQTTVNLVLRVMQITRRKCFRMVNFYMLLSNMHLSASTLLLLNQIILLI